MINKFHFYNDEVKMRFLDYYSKNENTIKTVSYMLQKAQPLEDQLKKDLAQYDMFEVDQLAQSLKTTSEQQIRTTLSIYSSYTDWSIKNRIGRSDKMNFYRIFLDQRTDLKAYVSKVDVENMYIDEEDIDIITSRLVNAQDKAFILALYEGIRGVRLSELRNLKVDDINDDTNEVILYGETGKRTIVISDKLKKMLYEADKKRDYIINNDVITGGMRSNKRPLYYSGYIFKNKAKATEEDIEDGRLSLQTATGMVPMIKKFLQSIFQDENAYDFITSGSVYDSGMINKVLKAYDEGKLTSFDAGEIERILSEYKLTRNQASNIKRKVELVLDIKLLS